MYTVTSKEMQEIDRYTIEQIGIPAAVLMENAGRGVADAVYQYHTRNNLTKPWLILVGKGNNGGDGLVAARHLIEADMDVEIVYAVSSETFGTECALQAKINAKLGIRSRLYQTGTIRWECYAGIIDALLGTGTREAPREPYASLIREANESRLPIVSVDIPSGLDADSGQLYEPCIQAKQTVALAFHKRGLVQYPGADAAGEVIVCPIGIPAQLVKTMAEPTILLTSRFLFERWGWIPDQARHANTHKGSYGHVFIVAGSMAYSGAGLLAAHAALRCGAGLVSWALPEKLHLAFIGHAPELILAPMPDKGLGEWQHVLPQTLAASIENKDALVIGPGLNRFGGDHEWLHQLWTAAPRSCPFVVDADALNMIADAPGGIATLPKRRAATILTPHPGEMARLCGISVHEVQHNRIALARSFALQHEVYVVLKGARTVVACPNGVVFVNTTGNAGMATAGAGDVLAGMLGSLLAQGLDAAAACAVGVWLHGAAGDRAAAKRTSAGSLVAGDIVDAL